MGSTDRPSRFFTHSPIVLEELPRHREESVRSRPQITPPQHLKDHPGSAPSHVSGHGTLLALMVVPSLPVETDDVAP
jgi:hypothetical protein